MTCQRCGKDFPSTHGLAVEGVCRECLVSVSPQERIEAWRPVVVEPVAPLA